MRSSRHLADTLPDNVAGVISLDQARRKLRTQNEYVDTRHMVTHSVGENVSHSPGKNENTTITIVNQRERIVLPNQTADIIRTRPTSPPHKKDAPIKVEEIYDSVICSKCGKCHCEKCTNPHDLPSKWICGGRVNISPETAVEYATCMCCVKGIFYHCSKDDLDSDFDSVSEPCAGCSRPHCCKRWTCILATSLCLPCMCLYPPAKCGLMACTACYNRCRKKGCTCNCKSNSVEKNRSRSKDKERSLQYQGLLFENSSVSS